MNERLHHRGPMPYRRAIGVFVVCSLIGCGNTGAPGAAPMQRPAGGHRLANASSPYLRMHADNPVQWYPWGKEAFERARREDKPIFLSIGYSSCHWCHVMEEESFENEAIARILNEHFISIKVDREERPDVDEVYITAVQLMQGSAGWPLSVFLTPDGKPFYGGTYFPPEDRAGMVGFRTVLMRIAEAWKARRAELERAAQQVMDAVRQQLHVRQAPVLVPLDERLLQAAIEGLRERFDPVYGGFGYSERNDRIPKFPEAPRLALLVQLAGSEPDGHAAQMLYRTLDHMLTGGIYDQLGGGFHRYSTDRRWEVPHFEKMLYDNGQLLSVYAAAYGLAQRAAYRRVVEETVEFLVRELRSPEGAFYAALDADSEGREGWFYVWSDEQLREVLGAEAYQLAAGVFGLPQAPRLEGRLVLCRRRSPEEVGRSLGWSDEQASRQWESVRQKLLEVRERRVRPFRDEKILAGWNGYVIAGLTDAGQQLNEPQYVELAEAAAEHVLRMLWPERRQLYRSALGDQLGPPATLEDYAALCWALLRLAEATDDARWQREARLLADQMIRAFWDEHAGVFWFSAEEQDVRLPVRPQVAFDGPVPGATSLAVRALVRLAAVTGELSYARVAAAATRSVAPLVGRLPQGFPTLLLALVEYRARGFPEELLVGEPPRKRPGVVEVRFEQLPEAVVPGSAAELTVRMVIADGWHIYAHRPGAPYALPLEVRVNTEPVVPVRVVYPEAEQTVGEGPEAVRVLSGEQFVRLVLEPPKLLGASVRRLRIRCRVRYQACTSDRCQAPREEVLEVELPVSRQE